MKSLIIVFSLVCFSFANSFGQNTYFTKTGSVDFYSKASVEEISAVNKKATSILDKVAGTLEFSLLVKSFEFEKALMEEHFNENYMESDKFPKSTFKGSISNIKDVNFAKDGTYKVSTAGTLTMHGISKQVTIPGTITIKGGKISASSTFMVLLSDYNIAIPSVVKDKIAKDIKITVNCDYELYVKP